MKNQQSSIIDTSIKFKYFAGLKLPLESFCDEYNTVCFGPPNFKF